MVVYSIVATGVDMDRCHFSTPDIRGTYSSRKSAELVLKRLIEAEKEGLDNRYNKEERGEDFWEMYQDGEASACFTRLEILASEVQN